MEELLACGGREQGERDVFEATGDRLAGARLVEGEQPRIGERAVEVEDDVTGAARAMVAHDGELRVVTRFGGEGADRAVESLVHAGQAVTRLSVGMPRGGGVMMCPEVVRGRVALAEVDREEIPVACFEQPARELHLARDPCRERLGQTLVPAGRVGVELVYVVETGGAEAALHLAMQ